MTKEEKKEYLTNYKTKEEMIDHFLDMEIRYNNLYEGFAKATKELKRANERWEDYEYRIEKIYRYIISDEFDSNFEEGKCREEVKKTIEGIIEE